MVEINLILIFISIIRNKVAFQFSIRECHVFLNFTHPMRLRSFIYGFKTNVHSSTLSQPVEQTSLYKRNFKL